MSDSQTFPAAGRPSAPSGRVQLASLLAGRPAEWPQDLLPTIAETTRRRDETVVVLDDDPTGTQTVRGARVLLRIDTARLVSALDADDRLLFFLTNSRSLPVEAAGRLARRLGRALRSAMRVGRSTQGGRSIVVISRSDSTMRGHFPVEVDALAEGIGQPFDATVLVPALIEAGRFTVDDVQYVVDGAVAIPAAETAFARDPVFGYRSSNLRAWVQERTAGRVEAADVASISLDELRLGGPSHAYERLRTLERGAVCIVNAASDRDLETFTVGLLRAEGDGRRFAMRTAATFVRVRMGLERPPLLTPRDLPVADGVGGLIVVGSHVPRSTEQLNELLRLRAVEPLELDVRAAGSDFWSALVRRIARRAGAAIRRGDDVAIYTSRTVAHDRPERALAVGRSIANGVADIVRGIGVRPGYVVLKGGITASVVARRGLGATSAWVLGQVLPGVPVWEIDGPSRHPDLLCVVFPGNVGSITALEDVVVAMRAARGRDSSR